MINIVLVMFERQESLYRKNSTFVHYEIEDFIREEGTLYDLLLHIYKIVIKTLYFRMQASSHGEGKVNACFIHM